ncbi:hypothetical protein HAX54_045643 [Datura stramonium]|uniref:Uncharacterized protein n=1 Tax=Datura stramonium TaxID=4076 RepID=A0ABS8RSX1_DATST|nr:hypothetical protein [Datura stramonium]
MELALEIIVPLGIFVLYGKPVDLIDFDQGGMARKFLSHKRHGGVILLRIAWSFQKLLNGSVLERTKHRCTYNMIDWPEKNLRAEKPNKYKPREHPQEGRNYKSSKDFEAWQAAIAECSKFVELGTSPTPTKIVILRPGPERMGTNENSWASSPGISEGRGNIEEFLEEVKERLNCELQGKSSKRSTTVRGEELRPPIVYRSDIQCDGASSPEFVKDTRRFLTERFRNVLKQETSHGIHRLSRGSSRSTELNKEKCSFEEMRHTSNTGDKATNLDRAHIRRQHEAIEKATMTVKKRQKEKFNLRRKVSSFSYSFILKGRLFGRKVYLREEPHGQTYNLMKDFPSPPTGTINFYERHENPTEVPPSPASVCSSVTKNIGDKQTTSPHHQLLMYLH